MKYSVSTKKQMSSKRFTKTLHSCAMEDLTWVLRDVPYVLKGSAASAQDAQAMDIYIPLRIWSTEERMARQKQITTWVYQMKTGQYETRSPVKDVNRSMIGSTSVKNRNENEDTKRSIEADEANSKPLFPVMLVVHGGAWAMGSRAQENIYQMCKALTRRSNMIVASVGYRLCRFQSTQLYLLLIGLCLLAVIIAWHFTWMDASQRVGWMIIALLCLGMILLLSYIRWTRDLNRYSPRQSYHVIPLDDSHPRCYRCPAAIHDVADSIRWLSQHANILSVDPTQIMLMGHSAGAHLISTLVTCPTYWSRTGIAMSNVRGVISVCGLLSAHYMKQDALFHSLATFVFTSDESKWESAFACELVRCLFNNSSQL